MEERMRKEAERKAREITGEGPDDVTSSNKSDRDRGNPETTQQRKRGRFEIDSDEAADQVERPTANNKRGRPGNNTPGGARNRSGSNTNTKRGKQQSPRRREDRSAVSRDSGREKLNQNEKNEGSHAASGNNKSSSTTNNGNNGTNSSTNLNPSSSGTTTLGAPPPPASGSGPEKKAPAASSDLNSLIQTIPEQAPDVFLVPVDWTGLEKSGALESKVKPWVSKKLAAIYEKQVPEIADYVFNDVILKVRRGELLTCREAAATFSKEAAAAAENESTMVECIDALLDEESLKFCIKLWRCLLLYSKTAARSTED